MEAEEKIEILWMNDLYADYLYIKLYVIVEIAYYFIVTHEKQSCESYLCI